MARIVYEDPAEGTVEKTVQNEHIAYFQDHWTLKTGEDEEGNDVVRRIPHRRVHYVERSVAEFEEEVKTVKSRVESLANDLQSKILGDSEEQSESEVRHIEVESGEQSSTDTDET